VDPAKIHTKPMVRCGGVGIYLAFVTALGLSLWGVRLLQGTALMPAQLADYAGNARFVAGKLAAVMAGATLIFLTGLIDDKRSLRPGTKLALQVLSAAPLVAAGITVKFFVPGWFAGALLTVAWVVLITNAFNFLDNMDGLSAGVAAICAAALLGVSASMGQVFVSVWLTLLLGALAGFLPYNFSPASSFMGDAGALVVGYFLGVLSCLVTYVPPGQAFYLYGVFVPLVVMALPLYDMVSVITLRIRERRNPMVGDRRHFSHRLVRRGMNVRTAVLTIYLCTGGTSIAASLLMRVRQDDIGAVLIFAQTLAILLIVALLEMGESKP